MTWKNGSLRLSTVNIRSLETNPLVASILVYEYRQWTDGSYYKIRLDLKDGTTLFCREYVLAGERYYSFHWQTTSGSLIYRWDNAPHYPDLATFPHHRHSDHSVEASQDISLQDILKCIADLNSKTSKQ